MAINEHDESWLESAPPTDFGDDHPPKRESSWPTAVAVIMFVWGGLLLFFNGCALIVTPFYDTMATFFEDAGLTDEAEEMRQMAELWWWWVIQGAVSTVLAILLIVAGIGLMKRLHRGVNRARIWAVLVFLQQLTFNPINVYLTEFHGKDADAYQQVDTMLAIVMVVFFAAIALILPAFLLTWFAREKIKREVAEWPR